MIAKILKIIYNIIVKESEAKMMVFKPFSSQISIFLSDGIMNPSRVTADINKMLSKISWKENYSLNLEDAPNDMPLVRYSSNDGKYIYDFAKKRINFYLNFNNEDNMDLFETYKDSIKSMLYEVILKYSNISRVGIAVNYYVEKKDDKYSFWVKKYNLPFYDSDATSEVTYTINNNFINKGLKYNNIIILSNGKINDTKVVPVISTDINNLPTAIMSNESIEYIFNEIDRYKKEYIEDFLEKDSK